MGHQAAEALRPQQCTGNKTIFPAALNRSAERECSPPHKPRFGQKLARASKNEKTELENKNLNPFQKPLSYKKFVHHLLS